MPEENSEQEHLMGGQGTQVIQIQALRDALVAGNGPRAGRVQACALAFVVSIWAMVLYATGGKVPFALYHPLLVSLGLYLLLQGILVLQSTQTPQEKDAGLALHQLFVLGAGLPLLTFGVWIMWHSHSKPGAKHFISWHGVLGVALLTLLWAQALLGASTVWAQEPVFGSVGKAKSVWKGLGYAIGVVLILEITLALWETKWARGAVSEPTTALVTVVVFALAFSVARRVKLSKLGITQRSAQ